MIFWEIILGLVSIWFLVVIIYLPRLRRRQLRREAIERLRMQAEMEAHIRMLEALLLRTQQKAERQNPGFATHKPSKESWWEVLELSSDAPLEQVKIAYHKKAKACHPDLVVDTINKEKRIREFQRINGAYEIAKAKFGVK